MSTTLYDAERAAQNLLSRIWWHSPDGSGPLPIDPFKIAQRLGIRVESSKLPPDQSGKLIIMDEEAVITLNRADHTNRQQFTCAHEIGHYLRRRQGVPGDRYVDYRGTLAGLGDDPEEIFANQFAAALLMPAHLVRQWHERGVTPQHMAQDLDTSTQAMQIRLKNLRLRPPRDG